MGFGNVFCSFWYSQCVSLIHSFDSVQPTPHTVRICVKCWGHTDEKNFTEILLIFWGRQTCKWTSVWTIVAAVNCCWSSEEWGPKRSASLKICGPEANVSVSLIAPWVFKVRNRASHGFCSQPDVYILGAHQLHGESLDRLNIFSWEFVLISKLKVS